MLQIELQSKAISNFPKTHFRCKCERRLSVSMTSQSFLFWLLLLFFLQQDSFERRIQEESNNSTEKANSLLEEEKNRHKV